MSELNLCDEVQFDLLERDFYARGAGKNSQSKFSEIERIAETVNRFQERALDLLAIFVKNQLLSWISMRYSQGEIRILADNARDRHLELFNSIAFSDNIDDAPARWDAFRAVMTLRPSSARQLALEKLADPVLVPAAALAIGNLAKNSQNNEILCALELAARNKPKFRDSITRAMYAALKIGGLTGKQSAIRISRGLPSHCLEELCQFYWHLKGLNACNFSNNRMLNQFLIHSQATLLPPCYPTGVIELPQCRVGHAQRRVPLRGAPALAGQPDFHALVYPAFAAPQQQPPRKDPALLL